jgi:hypothetical protein
MNEVMQKGLPQRLPTAIAATGSSTSADVTVSVEAEEAGGYLLWLGNSCGVYPTFEEKDVFWLAPNNAWMVFDRRPPELWEAVLQRSLRTDLQRAPSSRAVQGEPQLVRTWRHWLTDRNVISIVFGDPEPPVGSTFHRALEDWVSETRSIARVHLPATILPRASAFVKRLGLDSELRAAIRVVSSLIPFIRGLTVDLQEEAEEGEGDRIVFRVDTAVSSPEFLESRRNIYRALRNQGCLQMSSRMGIVRA